MNNLVDNILVIGAGIMGQGIAQHAASKDIKVKIKDIDKKSAEKSVEKISDSLKKLVKKDKITIDNKKQILNNITIFSGDDSYQEIGVVIEAVIEDIEVKKNIFKEIESLVDKECYLFTNTSALSVTEIFSDLSYPERCAGMHFFNPVPIMKLVEIVKGEETSKQTIDFMKDFSNLLDKTGIEVVEYPGFVVNRMLVPLINEAIFILQEGISTKEDIDDAMKLGANHPIGPLQLADIIGLDVCLAVMNTLHEEFGESKYRPAPLLVKKFRANHLGKKTKKGFYKY